MSTGSFLSRGVCVGSGLRLRDCTMRWYGCQRSEPKREPSEVVFRGASKFALDTTTPKCAIIANNKKCYHNVKRSHNGSHGTGVLNSLPNLCDELQLCAGVWWWTEFRNERSRRKSWTLWIMSAADPVTLTSQVHTIKCRYHIVWTWLKRSDPCGTVTSVLIVKIVVRYMLNSPSKSCLGPDLVHLRHGVKRGLHHHHLYNVIQIVHAPSWEPEMFYKLQGN